MTINWSRTHGYEVSTKGDARFSAFNALMPDGRSIEMHYQCDVKGYDVGGTNWRLGKGKGPKAPMSHEQQWQAYKALWKQWLDARPKAREYLLSVLPANQWTLRDRFASTPINQARALAELLSS